MLLKNIASSISLVFLTDLLWRPSSDNFKNIFPHPKRDLFYKIVLGDKSDNILPVFTKCGKKTVEKCYDNEEFFLSKLKQEDKEEVFEINKKLICFDLIPSELVELFYNNILTNL